MRALVRILTRCLFILGLLSIAGLWLYSHISPESFGTCHHVALNLGSKASLEECQAYGMTDFVVPLAVVVVALLLSSSGDIEFTIPGLGTIKRAREGKEAAEGAEVLKQKTETLDERGEKFLEDLPTSAPPTGRDQT